MTIQFSKQIVDKFIAPNVSLFTHAEIPDMSASEKESPYWIENFFLNSIMVSFKPPMNAYAYNFLRRAQEAFRQHHLARDCTLDFLKTGGQSPARYCDALFHWEAFLGQSWHAYAVLILKAFEGMIFEKGDGSLEERLNKLYNAMKHVESRIESGQMLPGATVPVWLTNEGLCSLDASMTYLETGEILRQLATWANALMNPKTAKEAFTRLDTE